MKTALVLSFVGTGYCGWQVQRAGLTTVQAAMCAAAESIYGRPVPVTGCSRTDAGVHALGYVCHIDAPFFIDTGKLPLAFNRLLPPDIAVRGAFAVGDDFHARYSALGKEYVYRVLNRALRDPFCENRALLYPHPLDVGALESAGRAFVGTHDFASFMSAGSGITDTVRTVTGFRVTRSGDFVEIAVSADGFLYNMVRIMAGTLIYEKNIDYDTVSRMIASRARSAAGATAPAHGLYLNRVFYPERFGIR